MERLETIKRLARMNDEQIKRQKQCVLGPTAQIMFLVVIFCFAELTVGGLCVAQESRTAVAK